MRTLRDQVQEFMDREGLNPTTLARRVGTSRQNIESLLSRSGDGLPKFLRALAKAMRTTADALLAGEYAYAPAGAEPVRVVPAARVTVAAAVLALAGQLEQADEGTREAVAVLLERVALRPQEAHRTGTLLARLLETEPPAQESERGAHMRRILASLAKLDDARLRQLELEIDAAAQDAIEDPAGGEPRAPAPEARPTEPASDRRIRTPRRQRTRG